MLPVRILTALLIALVAAVLLPLTSFDFEARAEPDERPRISVAPAQTPEKTPEYGAIAFAPDGSFFSVWKIASQAEAEDKARAECNALERGLCEALSFRGEVCAAIASGEIGKDRKITYSGGGLNPGDAERIALARCNADRRAQGSCRLRTSVCGDGRAADATARASETQTPTAP
jgi:uncharacterized protein DUF4189